MDVFVDEQHRGLGLARALVQFVLDHPAMKYVVKWTLATHDAHDVYRQVGFSELPDAPRWMALVRPRGWIDVG
ncbi:MAG TPA: GNAT family N-acetyltransferase [Polyangiaceae bacterium]|nr:GNAT family N-acetyltransferase [Polyangiaceae bacterium]